MSNSLAVSTSAGLPAMGALQAETVSTGYRLSGSAETLTLSSGGVSTPLVTGVGYSGTGQLVSRSYGNGVSRNYTWSAETRALTGLSASFVTNESGSVQTVFVQKDAFTRDVMGRITTSTNEVPVSDGTAGAGQVTAGEVKAECFSYDGFNRLSSAWTVAGTGTATCGTAAPADVAAPGWDASVTAYSAQWSYSAGGRITGLVKGAGSAAVTSTYAYADAAHTAAVTSVTGGTTTDGFVYDAAGRMVSRTVDGVATALTWDVTSSLTESSGQGGHVVYAHDASGQRVVQARVADADAPGTATAYVASGQVEDPNTAATSTGDTSATRYYTFAGSTVAMRTDDGQLALMLGDEQGSTSVMMPVTVSTGGALVPATLADASAVTRTSYTPYGELRGEDNLATDRGWLGQVEDRVDGATGTGLTYLNARYYDPVTMRFISPDPLMNPTDPTTLDPYRYADNNPVVFTDATGLAPTMCTPIGPRQYQYCRTIGEMASPDSDVGAGYIDGSTDRLYAIGSGFTAEGLKAGVAAFQQERARYGFWDAVAHVGAAPLAVDDMADMAGCASGPIMCNQYDLGHSAGGVGTSTGAFAAMSTAAVFAPEAGYSGSLARPSVARPSTGQGLRNAVASIRTANPSAKTVLIGREMNAWVVPMAKLLDAGYYKGTPSVIRQALAFSPPIQRAVDLAFNKAWIRAQMAAGKRVLDVGQRDVGARMPPSPFYRAEQRATRNYSGSERYK